MDRLLPLIVLLAVCTLTAPTRSGADPGGLDTTFGGFGTGGVIPDLGFNANAVAIDPQGRLVLVGTDSMSHFHVQRRSGPKLEMKEDASFFIDSGQVSSTAYAVAFDPNGKIIVAGDLLLKDRPSDFAVARLTPDLKLDVSFAGGGTTSSDFNGGSDTAFGVVVQSDGKIVVAGAGKEDSSNGYTNIAIERFNADGNLDGGFGDGNGKRFIDIHASDGAQAVVLQPDGKILVAGYAGTGNEPFYYDGVILRLNSDGSDDGNFGDSGRVTTRFSGHDTYLNSLALTGDNKIVVAGNDDAQDKSMEIARYLSNGAPDTTFA